MTVNELKQLLANKKDILEPSEADALYWLEEIESTIYDIVTDVLPNKYISEDSISVVSGTSAYNLPADFYHIRPHGCGVFKYDSDTGEKTDELIITEKGSLQRGFYLDDKNDQIILTPEPSGAETLTLRYIPTRTELTSGSQTLLLTEKRWENLYAEWLYGYLQKDTYDSADPASIEYTMGWADVFEKKLKKQYRTTRPILRRKFFYRTDL